MGVEGSGLCSYSQHGMQSQGQGLEAMVIGFSWLGHVGAGASDTWLLPCGSRFTCGWISEDSWLL